MGLSLGPVWCERRRSFREGASARLAELVELVESWSSWSRIEIPRATNHGTWAA